MAKILLVEDDNNLREIYEARLQAEGYTIVAAKDGEEALVVAKQEHPDLIISDVMMPRVSGFEMLDILRNTEGFKDTKVIMLTALGQAEDQARADKLGANRYLVKSQVTLEDIVNAAIELLGGASSAPTAAPAATDNATTATSGQAATPPVSTPAPVAPVPAPAPVVAAVPTATAAAPNPAPIATPDATAPSAPAPQPPTPAPVATIPVATPPAPPAPPAQPAAPVTDSTTQAPTTPTPPAPVTPTTPSVAAPTPPTSDDQLMADAMRDLLNATPEASESSAPTTNATSNSAQASAQQPSTIIMPDAAPPAQPAAPVTDSTTQAPTTPALAPQASVESAAEPPETPAQTVPTRTMLSGTPPPANTPATTQAQPNTPSTPTPPEDETADSELDDSDAVPIARKKIISPISNPAAETKPDLNALLAQEELHNGPSIADAPVAPDGRVTPPHPPGHVISPNNVQMATPTPRPIDPSSIAL